MFPTLTTGTPTRRTASTLRSYSHPRNRTAPRNRSSAGAMVQSSTAPGQPASPRHHRSTHRAGPTSLVTTPPSPVRGGTCIHLGYESVQLAFHHPGEPLDLRFIRLPRHERRLTVRYVDRGERLGHEEPVPGFRPPGAPRARRDR